MDRGVLPPWSRSQITAPQRRTRGSTSPSRRRGLPVLQKRSLLRADSNRNFCGKLCGSLARRTGQPAEEIAEHMRRGRYLNAREALDYGLIDEITPVK